MPYSPQTWHDLPATDTPESAARFTTMETGIQLGASNVLTPTATKTSAYAAVAGDLVVGNATSGAFTVTLPASTVGAVLGIRKDDTTLNAITYATAGADTIGLVSPVASKTIPVAGTVTLIGISGGWVEVQTGSAVSSLDNRYGKADAFPLSTGEASMSRLAVAAINAPVTQTLTLSYFTAAKTETIANIKTVTSTAGSSFTLCRLGIYSEATNGDLTLVASIASDTTLWVSSSTAYSKTFSVAWSKTAGQRYAVGFLAIGTTIPLMFGLNFTNSAIMGTIVSTTPRIYGQVASQSDLPSTIAVGSIASAAPRYLYAEFS